MISPCILSQHKTQKTLKTCCLFIWMQPSFHNFENRTFGEFTSIHGQQDHGAQATGMSNCRNNLESVIFSLELITYMYLEHVQCSKKVLSSCLGQVNIPSGQVTFFNVHHGIRLPTDKILNYISCSFDAFILPT